MKRPFVSMLLSGLLILTCMGCSSPDTPHKSTHSNGETVTITDMLGRSVTLPKDVRRVICSGPGCLRYLTYLHAQSMAVAVDSLETRHTRIDARPYGLANKQFAAKPIFGEFRGRDNPELIAALSPRPQVIFKTFPEMGYAPDELQEKTGIPVVCLTYGDLGSDRESVYEALRLMASIVQRKERAEALIGFFKSTVTDLQQRTTDIVERPSCYVGGIAFKGPHGFRSTEPGYPPFLFVNARNVAAPESGQPLRHSDAGKEQIVSWNPAYLFIDLSTIRAGTEANTLYQLATDPAYEPLAARQQGHIYGVLPYNWYTSNHGNTLADAYFIGKILYPKRFTDIEPTTKANEIYTFLVGSPVFAEQNEAFGNLAFRRLDPDTITIGANAEVTER